MLENKPHDRFSKEIFSRKEIACFFLREYLPEDVRRLIGFYIFSF